MRLWNREDVSALVRFRGEMLGVFLLKKRALRERQNGQKNADAVDRPDTYLYVVDKETYELCFI